ncbi:unnamed protein product [Periconia digitata]|uniref:C2H2-type domain-containing protein n=1 Tax=Periconia digitata TaxID=1303443 RepID=A0A9W4UM14_9PLEO|nr:unnamed protein product [Periconia digitata]
MPESAAIQRFGASLFSPQPTLRKPSIILGPRIHSIPYHIPHTTITIMPTDLEQLLDMGFDNERATLASKATGSLQDAIDWLEKNQETPIDDLKAAQAQASTSDEPPALQAGEVAQSLVCNDCGKKFRSQAQAEWHASKTEHVDFSESTEEIKPLTEEEKKQRLEELKERLAAKRATQAEQEKEERKQNEKIRMKSTKESQDIKEELRKKEQLKEMQAKRKEKQEEAEARKRVLAKLEADKLERKRKVEAEKAARAGKAPPPVAEPAAATSSGPTTSKPASAYTEARLALQTPGGRVMKTFPVETTLFEVAHALEQDGLQVNTFTQNFPKKVYDKSDFGLSLKEAGMVPSAALIVG